jgi:hypothetical protein
MALDLSKLAALELPKKEIEVNILGDVQKVTVSAFDDGVSLDIADIAEVYPESQERRVRKKLLCECAGLSEDDAEKLIRYDRNAAFVIVNAVFDLRDEFLKARETERAKAEKNSNREGSVLTQA